MNMFVKDRELSPMLPNVPSPVLLSRPLAWSETTLKHLAPILAAGNLTLNRKSTDNEQPVPPKKSRSESEQGFS